LNDRDLETSPLSKDESLNPTVQVNTLWLNKSPENYALSYVWKEDQRQELHIPHTSDPGAKALPLTSIDKDIELEADPPK